MRSKGSLGSSVSLGSLSRALGVVVFGRGRWLNSHGPSRSIGLYVVARARPGCRSFHQGTLSSLVRHGCCWVHRESLGLLTLALGFLGFTYVLPGGRCVHPGSFGTLHPALEVFGLSGVVSSLWGSSGVVGFNRVRSGSRWVHQGLLVLSTELWKSLVLSGSLIHSVVHPVSLGSIACALGWLGSSGVVGYAGVHHGGRWVHQRSLGSLARVQVSLDSSGVVVFTLAVVDFILWRWNHSRAPWGS